MLGDSQRCSSIMFNQRTSAHSVYELMGVLSFSGFICCSMSPPLDTASLLKLQQLLLSRPLGLGQRMAGSGYPLVLHRMWENDSVIRDRARSKGALLVWPEPRLVGAPSKRAFGMNKVVLDLTAQWWCPQRDAPESLQVATIREEAWGPVCKSKLVI